MEIKIIQTLEATKIDFVFCNLFFQMYHTIEHLWGGLLHFILQNKFISIVAFYTIFLGFVFYLEAFCNDFVCDVQQFDENNQPNQNHVKKRFIVIFDFYINIEKSVFTFTIHIFQSHMIYKEKTFRFSRIFRKYSID